ncbi:hypothetical protein [Streptomyces sp. NPDC088358]|uniref:hypothetical protein n=1 Tax=Streptomyces sp. NPDC088358 TaxID=3365857 RepID=UPI003809BF83
MLVAVVALGAVVAVILWAGVGSDKPDKKGPTESSGGTKSAPTPSLSIPSELPSALPSELPSGLPSEFPSELPSGLLSDLPSGLESLVPNLADDEVPYYMLGTGDCFDTSAARPGQAAKRPCGAPHDAEVVKVGELNGTYATDTALKKAASALCEPPLEHKRHSSPRGPSAAPSCSTRTPAPTGQVSTRWPAAWPGTSATARTGSPRH